MQDTARFCCGLSDSVGCKFRPSDEELLEYFLYKKVSRMALPPQYDSLIRDCDLYGVLQPWQIWDFYKDDDDDGEEEDMFFFTQLKNKSRINRKVGLGSGSWQSEDSANKVPPGELETKFGFKKRFRYENKASQEHDGAWIMHEYSLDSSLLEPRQPNDYVLCRIRRNVKAGKKIKNKR
ncbi:hypothetical protein Dsin_012165 [Dipteronia sinensis]|uniref:NAC domain-containing protein n=1 Tax=Dipteronia sinensis TaxID=43782 RepID=A0AAE0AIU7_9ROSI|nr:hypothetical protein Dsin_012164 [Dipteronia sinensis]KAK3218195.1 hypothetical protein Dsin_012165 [Dipteronia sinensis]